MTTADQIQRERGGLANIHRAFLDFEEALDGHYYFYKKIMLAENLPLNRVQRELLATATSDANQCPYCQAHHQKALDNHTQQGEISETEALLFKNFAHTLTKEPWKASIFLSKFTEVGLTPLQHKHAVMIVSYFNMANRLAFGMDLELEQDYSKSCN